jgi:hypothetical protein
MNNAFSFMNNKYYYKDNKNKLRECVSLDNVEIGRTVIVYDEFGGHRSIGIITNLEYDSIVVTMPEIFGIFFNPMINPVDINKIDMHSSWDMVIEKQNIFDQSNQSNSIPWLLYLDESEKIIENLQHMLNNIRNNIHGTSVKKYKFFSD